MSTNPINSALLGHRWGAWLMNTSRANEVWLNRVQRVNPSFQANTTKFYELGNVAPVGVITEPTEFRATIEENLYGSRADSILAGGTGSPVATFTAGDMVNTVDARLSVVGRDVTATDPTMEYVLDSLVLAEVRYRFQIGGPCTVSYQLEGRAGNVYTTGSLVHTTWGPSDIVSPGAINGKDARVYFGSTGSIPANSRGYRLQSFEIRVAFPVQTVRELGNRAIVGKLADAPDITCEFDLLAADVQPIDEWHAISGTGYDIGQSNTRHCYVEVFDPVLSEGLQPPIKSFRVENCKPTTGEIVNAQVRGLATRRYSLTSTAQTTVGSAGLVIFSGSTPT